MELAREQKFSIGYELNKSMFRFFTEQNEPALSATIQAQNIEIIGKVDEKDLKKNGGSV